MTHKNIVYSEWLLENLDEPNIVIVDCQFHLGEAEKGFEAYKTGHIPGAIFLDLEKDLSGEKGTHGGRHPLPTIQKMVKTFSKIGISNDKFVVAYDDQGGAMAARLWWILKYLGHQSVAILGEKFSTWESKGYPVSTELPSITATSFIANRQDQMLASMEEVKSILNDENVILIDSRSEDRFFGKNEHIDPIAGHIPGAVVENWQNRLSTDLTWKSTIEQEEALAKYKNSGKEIIVYCGSGVTACANLVALADIKVNAKLYAGSWSDWISYKDNPIETCD